MRVNIRDHKAEAEAYREQSKQMLGCMSRPFPYNVPGFIPFESISCYKQVDMSENQWREYNESIE